jgi:hypothetical protein
MSTKTLPTSITRGNRSRPEEGFVMACLATAFSGSWRAGEDPPDAYLTFDEGTAAVEISTLMQQVEDDNGDPVSRWSQDSTAIAICNEVDK